MNLYLRTDTAAAISTFFIAWGLLTTTVTGAPGTWSQFRGERGLGRAEGSSPPIQFGPQSNLLWRLELPAGNSSPCILGHRLFLTGYSQSKLESLCIDRLKGTILWRQAAPATQFEPTHRLGSPASPTPCTDGERVYVYFGSYGLLAYDLEGRTLWQKPLPAPVVEFGTSSSPILVGNRVVLICDQDEGSYLLAVDKDTGATAWRVERPDFRRSFSTPFLWQTSKGEELVVPGSIWLKGYDPVQGTELWSYTGTSRVANTTPVAEGDTLIYSSWNLGADSGNRVTMPPAEEFFGASDSNKDGKLSSAEIPSGPVKERFSQMDVNKDGVVARSEWEMMREMFAKANNALLAIRAGGRGDITESHLLWKNTRSLPYVSSPLVHAGRVFTIKSGGLASCYDLKTGRVLYQDERVGVVGDYYSSAVAAGDRVYLGSQSGTMLVIRLGDTLEILARNDLGEPIMATPAIVDGRLYVRAGQTLLAFGNR